MNALLAVLLLVLCAFPSFAQRGEAEAYAGFPFMYESLDNGKEKMNTVVPAFSFGLAYSNYGFWGREKLGLFITAQFIFPGELKHQLETDRFDYDERLIFFDFQAGLAYKVYEKAAFSFPVSAGLHFFYLSGTASPSSTVMADVKKTGGGVGISAAVELHINPAVYIFFRVQAVLDFIGYTERTKYTGVNISGTMAYYIDGTDYTAMLFHLGVTPVLGVGISVDSFFD
jgi:hypothetical protein